MMKQSRKVVGLSSHLSHNLTLTDLSRSTVTPSACQGHAPGPCFGRHLLWSWQTGTWGQESTKTRWRKEGCGGPKSLVEQRYFISRNACLYIFSKMITQPLQRVKFHQLQQNRYSDKHKVAEESHWRESLKESKWVPFPMVSVLRTVCSSTRSCIPGTDKEQRVPEKWHTKENATYWIP